MKARLLGSALVALTLAAGLRAQAPSTPPRAPDGHPDLQGDLVLWLGDAARTAEGVRGQDVPHRRRGGRLRAADGRTPRRCACGPCARMARLREADGDRSADVPNHRSARWTRAAADAGGACPDNRAARENTERPRRQPRGSPGAGAVPGSAQARRCCPARTTTTWRSCRRRARWSCSAR